MSLTYIEGVAEVKLNSILTSALDGGGQLHAPAAFLTDKEAHRQLPGSAPAEIRIPDRNNIVVQSLY